MPPVAAVGIVATILPKGHLVAPSIQETREHAPATRLHITTRNSTLYRGFCSSLSRWRSHFRFLHTYTYARCSHFSYLFIYVFFPFPFILFFLASPHSPPVALHIFHSSPLLYPHGISHITSPCSVTTNSSTVHSHFSLYFFFFCSYRSPLSLALFHSLFTSQIDISI